MKLVKSKIELADILDKKRSEGCTIGFVPTMGALHKGHTSLIEKAVEECDFVVASLFVNPTQFNNPSDLSSYPRDSKGDCDKLRKAGCDLLFEPDVDQIYGENKETKSYQLGEIASVMEGEFRPGHFNGVAQVVSILFDIVKPKKAFFGLKDFQQLAIIKQLVKIEKIDVEIVPCETVREEDGLAMSSRNLLLTPDHRAVAPSIREVLLGAAKLKGKVAIDDLKRYVIESINSCELLKVEYFDIVNSLTLQSVSDWDCEQPIVGCIAVFAGEVRLIDNIIFE